MLKRRDLWKRIDHLAVADESNSESEGMILSNHHNIDIAPFFIVEDHKQQRIYRSVLQFIREELENDLLPSAVFTENLADKNKAYEKMEPQEILMEAQQAFGRDLGLAFSGAEDVVLIDMAARNAMPFRVFCLDTGRLHAETGTFIDRVREHYGIVIEIYTPSPALLEPMIREKGLHSFYREGHQECCSIRKVEPLKRALAGLRAWVSGLRQDQSPATRSRMPVLAWDEDHQRAEGGPLLKFNPLLHWNSNQIWAYIRENDVPYNPLHDQGYRSIGCAPCTRPSRPGEHERMARWWWEDATRRECGLHA